MALDRLNPSDSRHVGELKNLRAKSVCALEKQARLISQKSVYHFGKLPVEICATVFALSVEESKSAIVTLSHVCRHWRDVALGAPELWRSLTLTRKTTKRQVEAWIQRSRSILYELSTRDEFLMEWRPDISPILSGILWERLETLSLDLTTGTNHLHNLLPPGVYQRLRPVSLAIVDKLSTTKQTQLSFWEPLEGVDLSRVQSLALSHVLSIPWMTLSRVTTLRNLTLSTQTISITDIYPLLHANPQLEELHLECASRPQPSSTVPSPTETPPRLPNLTRMTLRLANAVQYLYMCRVLAPNLTSLHIENALHSTSYLDALLNSTEGSLENLVELTFKQCMLDDQMVVHLLKRTNMLEKLCLHSSLFEDVNTVVDALARHPRDTVNDKFLCPRLRHVDLSQQLKLQTGCIVKLVKAHLAYATDSTSTDARGTDGVATPIVPLHTVIVDSCPNISADALPWLRSKVEKVSCVFMTKRQASAMRRAW